MTGRDRGPVRTAGGDLHRRRALGRAAVAELTGEVPTPAPQRHVVLDRARVEGAGADIGPVVVHTDSRRCRVVVGCRAGAELPVGVVTPAPQRLLLADSARVVATGRQLAPVRRHTDLHGGVADDCWCRRRAHRDPNTTGRCRARRTGGPGGGDGVPVVARTDVRRHRLAHRGAVAELAVEVVAPAVERAGSARAARVRVAAADRGPVGSGADSRRNEPPHHRAVTDLARRVLAPAEQLSRGSDTARVIEPRRDRAPVGAGADPQGNRAPGSDGAVAELTVEVLAPAPELPTGSDTARVEVAGADREPVAVGTDARRHPAIGAGAVTELSDVVVAPAVQLAAVADPARVRAACTHRQPVARQCRCAWARASPRSCRRRPRRCC